METKEYKYTLACLAMCAILCHSASSIMMSHAVILNGVKNLDVSVTVDRSTSLETLRYTQDDIASEEIATVCSKPRNDGG